MTAGRSPPRSALERLAAVGGGRDRVPLAGQELGQRPPDIGVVLHDEDGLGQFRHGNRQHCPRGEPVKGAGEPKRAKSYNLHRDGRSGRVPRANPPLREGFKLWRGQSMLGI